MRSLDALNYSQVQFMKSILILSSVLISSSVTAHDTTEMNGILDEYLAGNSCPNVAQISELYVAARDEALVQPTETNVSKYKRYQKCVVGAATEYAKTAMVKSFEAESEGELARTIKLEESTQIEVPSTLSDEELIEELF